MIEWNDAILRDICQEYRYGYTASATDHEVGPKFLRITDIVPDSIDWEEVPYCEIDKDQIERFLLREGDVVIARTGATTGYAKLIRSAKYAVFASYLVRLRFNDDQDSTFWGYVVESQNYKNFVQTNMGGAAQPNANAQVLTSFPIKIPPLDIQKKIAQVLAAYDELIEINLERIKLLQEAADCIYREWFIEHRFPGWDSQSLEDDIPIGWETIPIGKAVDTLGGGTPKTSVEEYWDNGNIVWFTPSDLTSLGQMFIDNSERRITQLGLENSSAKLFPAGSVMMTSRATIGVTAINTVKACTNQGFITCIPNERVSAYQIFYWIKYNFDIINQYASGATYKEINKTTFRSILIQIADPETNARFIERMEPLAEQIQNLLAQNKILRETRDLLLPRLISGDLDISDLNLPIE